jgi:rRNA processing protein Krr1/Pno1
VTNNLKKGPRNKKKKEAKRAEKAAAEAARQKEEAAKKKEEEAAAAAAAAASGGKKKKKKKKAKAAAADTEKAAAPVVVEKKVEEVVEDDDWSTVPTKKSSKKVAVVEAPVSTDDQKVVHEATIEFDCDPKMYPRILGVGGSNLKALQLATGTEIHIPKKGAHSTTVIISGTKAGCLEIKKNLTQLVEKGYCDITQPGTTDSCIEVPPKQIGAVIGRGGENIKTITKETGAKINMPDRDSDSNTVTITGSSEAVQQAMNAIKQLMEKGFSDITHANHTMATITVHRDSLGTLLGTRGATIKKIQEECKVKINIPKTNDEFIQCSLVGESSDIINCRIRIEAMLVEPEPEPIAPEWTQQNILKNLDVSW